MTVAELIEVYEGCISSLLKTQSRRRFASLKRISPANFSKEVFSWVVVTKNIEAWLENKSLPWGDPYPKSFAKPFDFKAWSFVENWMGFLRGLYLGFEKHVQTFRVFSDCTLFLKKRVILLFQWKRIDKKRLPVTFLFFFLKIILSCTDFSKRKLIIWFLTVCSEGFNFLSIEKQWNKKLNTRYAFYLFNSLEQKLFLSLRFSFSHSSILDCRHVVPFLMKFCSRLEHSITWIWSFLSMLKKYLQWDMFDWWGILIWKWVFLTSEFLLDFSSNLKCWSTILMNTGEAPLKNNSYSKKHEHFFWLACRNPCPTCVKHLDTWTLVGHVPSWTCIEHSLVQQMCYTLVVQSQNRINIWWTCIKHLFSKSISIINLENKIHQTNFLTELTLNFLLLSCYTFCL